MTIVQTRRCTGVLTAAVIVASVTGMDAAFAADAALTPRIVSLVAPSPEVVVADAVVTDAPFLADPTGRRDSTQAFTDALAAVSTHRGGTVFAPPGIFRIDGTLVVPGGTTLRGADLPHRADPDRIGTLLLASFGQGNETAASFISLGRLSCVRDLAIWYPSQGFTSDTVHPYPVTISFDDAVANATNIRLYDSYDGIAVRSGSNHLVADIEGTVLHSGLTVGNGYEYSWLSNVSFGNATWKSAPPVVSNAPSSDEDRLALDAYTSSHVTGVQIGSADAYEVSGVRVRDAQHDVLIKKLPGDPWPFYGMLSQIDGRIEDIDGYREPDHHFLDTDHVPGAENLSYEFVGPRSASNGTNFVSVKSPPFNAAGDGLADDTAAIQQALDATGSRGGGTVYLPQGQFRVTRLTIPTGVELRGPLGGVSHHEGDGGGLGTCVLLGYDGRNTPDPASDPALLTLSPGSGIRGFDVVYPEQGYGAVSAPVLPYPFTIRGTGAGVWVENILVVNPYNLIDFSTFRCDDHFVSGVEASVLNTGILVGGGSQHGRIERVLVDRGPFQEFLHLDGPGMDALAAYTRQNADGFVFGSCFDEATFGLDSFDLRVGLRMLADGGGCSDSTFWLSSAEEDSLRTSFVFEGGSNLRFVGIAAPAGVVSPPSFGGTVDIFGTEDWGSGRSGDRQGGVFHFRNETSLTLDRTATASSVSSPAEGPSSAVDGSQSTMWTSLTGGTNRLTVDLDQPSEIQRWVVRHAGIDGQPEELNTSDYTLQVGDDGQTFSDLDAVTGNVLELTDRPASARARFVRLLVTQGTRPGADGRARIAEFEVFGNGGWQFTTDAEGWTPVTDISSLAVSDGKLEIASSGGQPTIASPDNLHIPTSKFAAVRVRMRNAGAPTSAKLSFVTQTDPVFSDAKSLTVGTVWSSPEYVDYDFDFSANGAWSGALKQLRLIPINGTGNVSIDSIVLESTDPESRMLVLPGKPPRNARRVAR